MIRRLSAKVARGDALGAGADGLLALVGGVGGERWCGFCRYFLACRRASIFWSVFIDRRSRALFSGLTPESWLRRRIISIAFGLSSLGREEGDVAIVIILRFPRKGFKARNSRALGVVAQ